MKSSLEVNLEITQAKMGKYLPAVTSSGREILLTGLRYCPAALILVTKTMKFIHQLGGW